jgi:hypothetical protein
MAVTFDYTGKLNKIISDTGEVRGSILNSRKAIQNINNAFLKKTKIRSEIFQRRQELNRRRLENESRREQEDVLEYSKMSSISKTPGLALARTGKSFLGRIMDFISNLAIGWLLYNLPTWIGMAKEFVGRVIKLGNIIGTIVSNASGIVISLGRGLVNIVGDIAKLNFAALPNDVFSAFNKVQTNIDSMGQQFEQGFQLFSTGLDKSLTGTEIPKVGQPLPEQPYSPGLSAPGSPGSGPNAGGGGGGSGGTVSPQAVYSYLKSKGMSENQALGITANIKGESGFRIGVSQGGGGPGVGLFQYSDDYRKPRFLKAVPNYKTNWQGQIDYAINEDAGPKYLKMNFSSPEEAAAWWMRKWERPDPNNIPGRDEEHNAFIKSFKPGNSQVAQSSPPVSSPAPLSSTKGPYNYNTYGYAPSNGQVQYMTGDTSQKNNYESSHGGGNYHDHLAFKDHETALRAFDFFKSKGFFVWEMKDRTSLGPSHQGTRDPHFKGLAFDVPAAQNNWPVGKEYQGSAKVRAALAQFLGTPQSQISSASSGTGAMTAAGLTPTSVGEDISVVIPKMGLSYSGGGGGGGQQSYGGGMALAESPATLLNNFVKNYLLVELAYL